MVLIGLHILKVAYGGSELFAILTISSYKTCAVPPVSHWSHSDPCDKGNSSSKAVLPPSQASVVESDIFVEMKSRCAKVRKQCFSALFSCKKVSVVLEQVSVNLGLCAFGIFHTWTVSKES